MKIILTVLVLVAVSYAADVQPFKIIRSDFQQQPEGAFVWGFETENGIVRNENGEVKEAKDEENKPHNVVVMRGSWSYTDPEGKVQTISYLADENGFQPEGDSIPKPVSRR